MKHGDMIKVYVCPVCNKEFLFRSYCLTHLSEEHPEDKNLDLTERDYYVLRDNSEEGGSISLNRVEVRR